MKTVLRILMVEDSEDDALLTLHQIKKGGYDIEYERIETADGMRALLREKTWDIILSDYKMPHFNGVEALSVLRESGLDIPFIMISGTIGEDLAVEAMRTGAQDYIMKNNVHRLLPAIERELRESKNRAERKQLELKQRQAEARLRLQGMALESAANCIDITDKEGRIIWANHAFVELTGYTMEEVVGQTHRILKSGVHDSAFYAALWQTILSGKVWHNEIVNRRKDGTLYTEEMTITPVQNQDGEITHFIAVKQNITDRKLVEEALCRLNRELRAISYCNQVLVRTEDEQVLLNDICCIICNEAGYRMAWVGYAENDDAKTVRPVAWAGVEDGYLKLANITWADTPRGRGPTGTAIRSGKSTCVQDFAIEPQAAPWRENALQRGYCSNIALPLKDENGKTFGALNIYSSEPNAFTANEIRLLEELSGDLAFGITTLRTRIERKQAEEALRQNEERLRSLFENAPDAIYMQSEGRFVYLNSAMVRLLGASRPEELLGREFIERVAPQYHEAIRQRIQLQQETGKPALLMEQEYLRLDGSRVPVETTAVSVQFQGSDAHMVFVRDITERKEAEGKLLISAKEWAETFDAMGDGVSIQGDDFVILKVNKTMARVLNKSKEEIVGQKCFKVIHGISDPIESCPLAACKLTQKEEYIEIFEPGLGKWLGVSTSPILNEQGNVSKIIHTVRDITKRRQAEDAVRAAWRYSRNLIETSLDPLVTISAEGKITDVNTATEKITGMSREKLIGSDFADYFTEPQMARAGYMKAFAQGQVVDCQLAIRHTSGAITNVLYNASIYKNEKGEALGVFVAARDITERKKAEELMQLHQANMAHLLRLGEVGEMASGLAHEINQPLCAIENYAQACLRLMETKPDLLRLSGVIKDIRDQAERAGKIVHRVKGMVRKKTPQFEPVGIKDIIQEAVELVSVEAKKREVQIHLNIPDNLTPVYADFVLIEQVILNLIRNSLEAMNNPKISRKELTIYAEASSNNRIEVCVSDTGCGIPAENMKKIFESFFTTKPDGLGIGLSLSRAIIESHTGQLWATANAEGGTTFHFTVSNVEKLRHGD